MSLEPLYAYHPGTYFREKQTNNSAIRKSFIVKKTLYFWASQPIALPLPRFSTTVQGRRGHDVTTHYHMKKIIITAVAGLLSTGVAMAEGYQINSLSTKQIGMGHTGVALKLGAENMYFNPAGMAYMDKTLDLSGSFTGIMPTATATVEGKDYETDNGVSTPISVNAAFSIYPNLKGGISFYTPYGSAINWTDNWPGSVLSQNVSLKAFTIQPTLAWAINDKFSIGLGAMVTWATVDLNKGLVSASTADNVIAAMKQFNMLPSQVGSFGSTTPASVNLNGKTEIAVGFNIGAMYNINEKWTVGASYRSKMDMKVKSGEAHVSYANEMAQTLTGETLDLINNANFKAQMPCPWVLSLGTSYKPTDRLTLAFDARLTGWHAYKTLNVEFLDEQLVANGLNQYIPKHYKNSWCFSLGAEYALTDRLDLRAGLMVDTSPVDKNYYNPETPGMTKIEPTLGLSFRPIPQLSVDLGFMYVAGAGIKNASCESPDLMGKAFLGKLLKSGMSAEQVSGIATQFNIPTTNTFTADYKLHAFIPSIGISYSF